MESSITVFLMSKGVGEGCGVELQLRGLRSSLRFEACSVLGASGGATPQSARKRRHHFLKFLWTCVILLEFWWSSHFEIFWRFGVFVELHKSGGV